MNPKCKRLIRHETISPGNVDAIWKDGDGNRWRAPVERNGEFVW